MLKSMQNIGNVFLILRGISTAFNQGLLTGIASLLIIQLSQKNRFKLSGSSIVAAVVISILHSISNYFFPNLILSLCVNLLFLPIIIIFMIKPRVWIRIPWNVINPLPVCHSWVWDSVKSKFRMSFWTKWRIHVFVFYKNGKSSYAQSFLKFNQKKRWTALITIHR